MPADIATRLKRDEHGLFAAIIQQYDTRDVLMLGWMNDEALRRTLTEGRVTFWSRSRQEYWRKGDTSGHYQYVKSVSIDCDGDALLIEADRNHHLLPSRRAAACRNRRPPRIAPQTPHHNQRKLCTTWESSNRP